MLLLYVGKASVPIKGWLDLIDLLKSFPENTGRHRLMMAPTLLVLRRSVMSSIKIGREGGGGISCACNRNHFLDTTVVQQTADVYNSALSKAVLL